MQPIRIQKTFILQEETTNKTKVIPFNIYVFKEQIDLFPIISYALQGIKGVNIKIYDFKSNKYVNIQTLGIRFHVPASYFNTGNHIVLLKYNFNHSETMSISSYNSSIYQDGRFQTQSKKNQRSKERIILEVIQIVKKWRKFCQNKRGQTLTLAQAAQKVGLPKKSLDDYYYQLRMGQKYGFDYHEHMLQRIGVLRSFLKKFKTHRKGDKNEKLPNVLNIADQIDGYQSMIKQNKSQPQMEQQKQCKQQIQEQYEQKQQNIKKQNIQKQFYNQFNYSLGRQLDPFLALGQQNQNQNLRLMNQESNDQKYDSRQFQMFF